MDLLILHVPSLPATARDFFWAWLMVSSLTMCAQLVLLNAWAFHRHDVSAGGNREENRPRSSTSRSDPSHCPRSASARAAGRLFLDCSFGGSRSKVGPTGSVSRFTEFYRSSLLPRQRPLWPDAGIRQTPLQVANLTRGVAWSPRPASPLARVPRRGPRPPSETRRPGRTTRGFRLGSIAAHGGTWPRGQIASSSQWARPCPKTLLLFFLKRQAVKTTPLNYTDLTRGVNGYPVSLAVGMPMS